MDKLSNFLKKSSNLIEEQTKKTISDFITRISNYQSETSQGLQKDIIEEKSKNQKDQEALPSSVNRIPFSNAFEAIALQQSKIVVADSLPKIKPSNNSTNGGINNSKINEIQNEKQKILDQLRKIDVEIADIRKEKQDFQHLDRSMFRRKVQISDDIEAKKQAQSLIKQLHLQKIKIEEKKKQLQQKQLTKKKQQEEFLRKERQEIERKLKQQKRQIIERRLEEQKRKRLERKLVDKQSNLLISELKKQEQFEKQQSQIPTKIMEYDQQKKLLQKKNIFNISEIQNHQKKYIELKSKQKQLRRQRSSSIKVVYSVPNYGKNIWVQKIQEEQAKRKQQQKLKELNKKIQWQKRMKYGDIVKNIFMSKNKKKKSSVQRSSHQQSVIEQIVEQQIKPITPQQKSNLPQIVHSEKKRQNQTDKKFKQRQSSNSIIQIKRSKILKPPENIKQKDSEQAQKLMKQKQREQQLRKQTKQRLKKIENKSIDLPKTQKVKYENYIAKVKVKKSDPHEEWKKIMSNESLSKQQKYKEMLKKASYLQNQAKIKEDLRRNGDEDAVNLYIGSIQAKLALLEKF